LQYDTIIGGKRQGREVPQSVGVEPRLGGIWKTQIKGIYAIYGILAFIVKSVPRQMRLWEIKRVDPLARIHPFEF
jgi:hypothetical protein